MSAIAGLFRRNGAPADPADVARMAASLETWGPDAVCTWGDGPVALSQRVLTTTPEAAPGARVVRSPDGGLALVADVRLDNRAELCAQLDVEGGSTRGPSDEELVLRAYERWGSACPGRLLGDFAFAIWDREKRTLTCARDPMGVRPFYYYMEGGFLAFATQIKALHTLPEVPRRLDEETLADYLALLPPSKVTTFYRDIRRLHPGHTLEVSPDRDRLERYWSLDGSREVRLGSDAEYAEAFREVFTEAVRCRLRSVGPVGAMLSGGLDSSSIVCTARNVMDEGDPLVTISGTFPSFREKASRVDERSYIDMVVSGGGIEARYVAADRTSPMLEFLWQGEEPIPAASLYMDWTVLGAARERGVRVLLSGNDGDSVVGYGRTYLAELAWRGRWRTLGLELRALSERYGVGRRALLREWVLTTLVPTGVVTAWKALRPSNPQIYDRRSVLLPEFARRSGAADRARRAYLAEHPLRRERDAHREDLDSSLMTLLLEVFGRAAAEFAVEPRYPFFDRRLVEFCLALPGDQKLYRGWDRTVMRRAMEGILPPGIQWRQDKQNLTPNFNLRLLESKALLDEVILGDAAVLRPYVDVDALRAAYGRYLAEPARRVRDGFTVFWTSVFALWLRDSGVSA